MAQQEVEIYFKIDGLETYIDDLETLNEVLDKVQKNTKETSDEVEDLGKSSKKGGGFLTSLGKKGKAAFGALKGAIAATGIGLLLTAFAQLVEWFKKTDAGAKILQGTTAALGVIFDRILILLEPIGTILSDLFTNPVESIKNFGNLIKQNIEDRFTALVEGLGFVGDAFKKLFEGDFSGAAEAASNAFTKIAYEATGLEDVVEGVKTVVNATTEAFADVGEEINKVIQDTNNLVDANNRLASLQNELLVQNAQLTKDLEEQKKISEDTTRSYDERSEALEKVIEANEQLVANALLEAQETEKLLQAKLALTKNDEDRRELEAELANATAERIAREQEASIVELESAQLRRELDQEEVDRKMSINGMIEDMRTANIQDEEQAALRALELAEEAALNELNLLRATDEEKLALQEEFQKQKEAIEDDFAQKRLDKAEEDAKKEDEIRKAQLESALAVTSSAFATISQIAGEQSALGKAAAVASATIDTYAAANNALKNTPAPPPFPAIAAGVAIAAGLANVRKILAIKVPGNKPSAPPPTISAGPTPQFQLPTAPGSQGEDIVLGGQNGRDPEPFRAYVVATDVTSAQQANQQIENLSRL